jgi:signal transduction histidine kinase
MKVTYKQKLALYFFVLFSLFTIGIIIFERSREAKLKTEALEEKLDAYAEIINGSLEKYPDFASAIENLSGLLPKNLRITLINQNGNVAYDNAIGRTMPENHATRPEIVLAKTNGHGSNIRTSATNNQKYLYYAKQGNGYFIRVAFPYDIKVQAFLKSDNMFLFYIVLLFIITLILIYYVANRFSTSIRKLKEFALSDGNNITNEPTTFPKDELGEIGKKIIDNYEQIRKRKKELILEREKLLQHAHSSGEGLCFFFPDKKVGLYNGLFIQYLNIITDESASDPSFVFADPSFRNVADFLSVGQNENYYETRISKQGKHFNIRVNVFVDRSFEIIINDISKQEKTRLLKQEMTSNIAHELRTPVTSIRGFLEIALGRELNDETAHNFLNKAHEQTLVLTELMQDMSLITKMEEAPLSFQKEDIQIDDLLHNLKEELNEPLSEKNIRFEWSNMEQVIVQGNRNLIYSIFRNLTDNAIRYAGTDVTIKVSKYNEDKDFYYFSFSDTGVGIQGEHHLNRIFERFYRVNEGRTRDTGGSGLGLSIVKNAILFHKGTIVAKNKAGGGLEFLFTLPKGVEN